MVILYLSFHDQNLTRTTDITEKQVKKFSLSKVLDDCYKKNLLSSYNNHFIHVLLILI